MVVGCTTRLRCGAPYDVTCIRRHTCMGTTCIQRLVNLDGGWLGGWGVGASHNRSHPWHLLRPAPAPKHNNPHRPPSPPHTHTDTPRAPNYPPNKHNPLTHGMTNAHECTHSRRFRVRATAVNKMEPRSAFRAHLREFAGLNFVLFSDAHSCICGTEFRPVFRTHLRTFVGRKSVPFFNRFFIKPNTNDQKMGRNSVPQMREGASEKRDGIPSRNVAAFRPKNVTEFRAFSDSRAPDYSTRVAAPARVGEAHEEWCGWWERSGRR